MTTGDDEVVVEGPEPAAVPTTPHVVALRTAPWPTGQHLWRQVAGEIRWSLTPPWTWLSGVAANLALSLIWLIWVPLRGAPHRDWAIVVGTYFAIFILADVTTTNVLGADAVRVRLALLRDVALRRILLVKNLTLVVIVGLPTLIATAAVTLASEADYRLVVTLPGVAFPILTWLGVGNLVSVVLPVAAVPLRERWRRRRQLWPTTRWLLHLGLPYALLLLVGPVSRLPTLLSRGLHLPRSDSIHGLTVLATGLALWGLGTTVALMVARSRGVPLR